MGGDYVRLSVSNQNCSLCSGRCDSIINQFFSFRFLLRLPLRFRRPFLIAVGAINRMLCFREALLVQHLGARFALETVGVIVRAVVHINDLGVGDGELAGGAFMETVFAEWYPVIVEKYAVVDFYRVIAFLALVAVDVIEGLSACYDKSAFPSDCWSFAARTGLRWFACF